MRRGDSTVMTFKEGPGEFRMRPGTFWKSYPTWRKCDNQWQKSCPAWRTAFYRDSWNLSLDEDSSNLISWTTHSDFIHRTASWRPKPELFLRGRTARNHSALAYRNVIASNLRLLEANVLSAPKPDGFIAFQCLRLNPEVYKGGAPSDTPPAIFTNWAA